MKFRPGYWLDKLDVPLTLAENIEKRKKLVYDGEASDRLAKQLLNACREDPFFFISVFGWLLEPRDTVRTIWPFCLWPIQRKAVATVYDCMFDARCDALFDKSRGMGATWLTLYPFLHLCLFDENKHFACLSKNEDTVDRADDPDALFQKLDFAIKHLPKFIRPKASEFSRSNCRFGFDSTGSTIIGYPATSTATIGGRKLAIMLDEWGLWRPGEDYRAAANTQHVANTRFFISAIYQPSGAHFDMLTDPELTNRSVKVITLDWKDNPNFSKGLYTSYKGQLRVLDKGFEFPPDYNFVLDGLERSPWVDREFNKVGATKADILRQVYRLRDAAGTKFFDLNVLEQAINLHGQPPMHRGTLVFDQETHEGNWHEGEGGPMRLWCPLDVTRRPPGDRGYVIFCDICAGNAGAHTNNSVASVWDTLTGEQAGEFVTNAENPTLFANSAVALCKFFVGPSGPAYLGWEANGPVGMQFGAEILRIGYSNVYMRKTADTRKKTTRRAGWMNDVNSLPAMLSQFQLGVSRRECIPRSVALLAECKHYIWDKGTVVCAHVATTDDATETGKTHGDRVIAAAGAWMLIQDRPAPKREADKIEQDAPVGSVAWRLAQRKQELAQTAADDPCW